jgi:hypothetical protein
MTLYEIEGFLRGKCLPGDLLVNESTAEYIFRKMKERDELIEKLEVISGLMGVIEQANELAKQDIQRMVDVQHENAAAMLTLNSIIEILDPSDELRVSEQVAALKRKCDALAAEGLRLKSAHPQPFGREMMKALDAYEKHHDEVPETGMLDAFFILRDSIILLTPATDAAMAELKAKEARNAYESILDNPAVFDMESLVDWLQNNAENSEAYAAELRKESGHA